MDTTVENSLVGHLLDGRYRVEGLLARGGMASVYRALDTRLDRWVAVKVMHPALAADADFVARFIREAKSAARLSHPSVVNVFDQGKDGEAVFLAMEYIEGRTLRDLLRERGRLSVEEAFDVLEPVLAALGAAHRAGIVHRDVKPENVLLADDGRIKVADFGLARAVSGGTSNSATQGLLLGTVAYLSPEQVERGIADARSDVYSAGIVLFEMLTGTKPYDGQAPLQVAFRHVHDDVPLASSRLAGLPGDLDDLVQRATRRDPDVRPADATRFLAEVVRLRRTLGITTAPMPRVSDSDRDTAVTVALPRPGSASGPAPAAPQAWAAAATTVLSPWQAAPAPDQTTGASPSPASPSPASPSPASPSPASPSPASPSPAAAGTATQLAVPPAPPTAAPPTAARPDGPYRRRRRGPVALVLLVVLAALLGLVGWYLGAGPGAKIPTPSLLGLTQARAAAKADQVGLKVRPGETTYSETVPEGDVVTTRPAPNSAIRKGGTITLVLSKGKERYPVPDLRGKSVEDARQTLEDTKLAVGRAGRRYDDTVPAGNVAGTDPVTGTKLKPGAAVTLFLSRGPAPVEIKDFRGKDVAAATAALTSQGLKVAREERNDDEVPPGQVISQEPRDGEIPRGSTVTLVVSLGPPLVDVPDVTDMRTSSARHRLEDAGFKVKRRGTTILNRVFTQSPGGGQQAPKGSTVTITTI